MMNKSLLLLASTVLTTTLVQTSGFATSPKIQPPPGPQMATYVSGSGSDSNPCLVTSPCRTFQAALALTLPGGEIYVLDTADYGPLSIKQAVTITTTGGMLAGVLASSGAAITVSANANDNITLDGLDIDGGNSGATGIQFNSGGALNVRRTRIHNFANSGIAFSPSGPSSLVVTDTWASNNASSGIMVGGPGSAAVELNRVVASSNGVGFLITGAGFNATVTNSVLSTNNYGLGASSSASVTARNLTATTNGVGIAADQSAIVRLGQSNITANGTGWQATNGGQVLGFGDNNVAGNTTDNPWTSTVALQ
jgi:hypothetical protein